MTDALFADQVNAATYQHKINGNRLNDKTLAIQNRYRQLLRRAHRFVLDDEATRLVCHLSHEMKRLEAWSFLARLPHEPMWVELDLHVKVREFEAMGTLKEPFNPRQVCRRMGFLMYRDDPDSASPRWISHVFMDYEDTEAKNKQASGMCAYLFDPEGDPRHPLRGSTTWGRPTLSLRPGFPKLPVTVMNPDGTQMFRTKVDPELAATGMFELPDEIEATKLPDGSFDVHDPIITGPNWLAPRCAVIIDPWWEAYSVNAKPGFLNKAGAETIHEDRGVLRWIITLLAAINGLPKTMRPLNPTRSHRVIGMNNVPFFTHHNLAITIPGEDRRHHATQLLDRATNQEVRRRRWHMVRGFWRVIEYGRSTHVCRHQPVMVESGVGMCEKCELMIRWIEPQERGDQSLGVVDKTYQVTT